MHGILDNAPADPGARPFLEYGIAHRAIIQAGNKYLLRFFRIGRQHKRQRVQVFHVFGKNPAEVGAGRVRCGSFLRAELCPCHYYLRHALALHFPEHLSFKTSISLVWHLCASSLSRCLVRTPPQENFAPSFINSKIASSPSRLITVTFVRSITTFWAAGELPVSIHVFRSSSTHGRTRVPSTTSRRSRCVSMVEILNMSLPALNKCKAPAKPVGATTRS